MGKRVLAAFGVVAPMGGVLASGLSAAPTSTDAAISSTAERTGSSEEAQLRALYRQAVAEGGRLVVFSGGDRSGQDDYLKTRSRRRSPRRRATSSSTSARTMTPASTIRAPKAEPPA